MNLVYKRPTTPNLIVDFIQVVAVYEAAPLARVTVQVNVVADAAVHGRQQRVLHVVPARLSR